MKIIDFRSDENAMPPKEMLEALTIEQTGCDGYQELIYKLEELAAKKMGKEAGLLTFTGSQASMLSIMSSAKRGETVIIEDDTHILYNMAGKLSMLAGVSLRPIPRNPPEYMNPIDVEDMIKFSRARTALICIENTRNRAGGIAVTIPQTKTIWDIAQSHDISVYTDGARIFNAAIYLNIDVKELTRYTDSIMFSLNKCLCVPYGAMLCGTEEFIDKARPLRRHIGDVRGTTGIIAAAGIFALTKMMGRIKYDHETATMLAEGLIKIGVKITNQVQTNLIYPDVDGIGLNSLQCKERLEKFNILIEGGKRSRSPSCFRIATHNDIDKSDIPYVINCFEKIAEK